MLATAATPIIASTSNPTLTDQQKRDYASAFRLLEVVEVATEGKETVDPQTMLNIIDKHCWADNWMMHMGDRKGDVLRKVMQEHKPKRVLELGTYCGYSGTLIAAELHKLNPDQPVQLVTIDPSPLQYAVAAKIIAKAGLASSVIFMNKYSHEAIANLPTDEKFDLVFIDHEKTRYLPDLKAIVDRGLVKSGGVVVADNVLIFDSREYLEYVKTSGKFVKNELIKGTVEYSDETEDAMDISVLA
ncbi:hypothetical protein PhCBS80983_g05880 [Powellomyces hirtus]|uniref:catechol O-methyltransferase n=1 Tax=Powellomyces hirtus TaxID=109895 RepID=A0A507DSQ3_9FUNG|nr:hypothetical protein PhCBS80983_g05880 [Powellomyces hirtus]